MIEYSEILAETIANLKMDYTDAEVLDKFDVLNKINAAQRSILRLAPISQVDNILKTVTGDLQINVPTMAWPSDYVRVSKLFVDYLTTISNTNPGVEATMAEKGTFQTRSLDQRPSKQYPKFYYVDGGFELRPMPDAAVTDGFMLVYVYAIPDMADGTQDSLLRYDLKNALVFKATALCAAVDDYNIEMSKRYDEMFMNEIKGLWGDNVDKDRKA